MARYDAEIDAERWRGNSFVFYGGEKGYPWIFFNLRRPWVINLLLTLVVVVPCAIFYNWYSNYGADPAPDSVVGYAYAIVGSVFMVLALVVFSIRRRSSKRQVGKLNRALNSHMFFGLTGMALLAMHSFGNLNPRTGTYALWGMIAMTVSGLFGRLLDQIVPRLITGQVDKALTGRGDDQVDRISQQLHSIVAYNTQGLKSFKQSDRQEEFASDLGTPWDLAYISMDATPQERARDASFRYVPDKRSSLGRPGALMPGAEERVEALRDVQKAMQREQYYRYVIRYWRKVHIALAFVTVGLTLWHLEYAATLLIPVFFH